MGAFTVANEVVVARKSIPARDIDRVWTKNKSKLTKVRTFIVGSKRRVSSGTPEYRNMEKI